MVSKSADLEFAVPEWAGDGETGTAGTMDQISDIITDDIGLQPPQEQTKINEGADSNTVVAVENMDVDGPPAKPPSTGCICGMPSTQTMVHCNSGSCQVGWYHLDCVGLEEGSATEGQWVCPACEPDDKKGERKKEPGRQYCICSRDTTDDMICCENRQCPTEWFHYSCVKLDKNKLPSKWTCQDCAEPTPDKIRELFTQEGFEYSDKGKQQLQQPDSDKRSGSEKTDKTPSYMCIICLMAFDTKEKLKEHLPSHSDDSPRTTPASAARGGRRGRRPKWATAGGKDRKVDPNTEFENGVQRFRCSLCQGLFDSIEALVEHVNADHPLGAPTSSSEQSESSSQEASSQQPMDTSHDQPTEGTTGGQESGTETLAPEAASGSDTVVQETLGDDSVVVEQQQQVGEGEAAPVELAADAASGPITVTTDVDMSQLSQDEIQSLVQQAMLSGANAIVDACGNQYIIETVTAPATGAVVDPSMQAAGAAPMEAV